ncbi:MAG: hypothetical protein M3Q29_12010 [Chloroflexota bacterium]|nr:hypothetical protein [Chloroflexota bacterium]
MKPGFVSEKQAREALERAVEEGRIVLTPEQEEMLRRQDEESRKLLNRIRRIFPWPPGRLS